MNLWNPKTIITTCLCTAVISISQAKDLYITDDYLQGLDDEISSPEYLEQAKKELRETEQREQSQSTTSVEIIKALTSMYSFESLLRKKYPSSYAIFSSLPVSEQIVIYDQFKQTKKLSTAKRLIINKYQAR